VSLTDLKISNLQCLKKHVTQLNNAMLTLAKTAGGVASSTFSDLAQASARLSVVQLELANSQRTSNGRVIFDTNAFDRARAALEAVGTLLTPASPTTSILGVASVLTYGSAEVAHVAPANQRLSTIIVPALIQFIQVEMAAVEAQTTAINYYVDALEKVVTNYRTAPVTSQMQEARSRLVAELSSRSQDLQARIDAARARQNLRAASAEMLLWSSRVKAMLSMMTQVQDLTLQEGSIFGPDKAAALQTAYTGLVTRIDAINGTLAVNGREDLALVRAKAVALAQGADRLLQQIDAGQVDASDMATFHALAVQVAVGAGTLIDQSISNTGSVRAACSEYAAINLDARPRFEQLTSTMTQLGLDRARDLLTSGDFQTFFGSSVDGLSYVGMAIKCLGKAIQATDSAQTKQQLAKMRDDLVGQQTNKSISLSDVSNARQRLVGKLQGDLTILQQNTQAVASIVKQFQDIGAAIGADVKSALAGVSELTGNLDHLSIGAGGRLSDTLEQVSEHSKAGVPSC
jgi:hypothetical protein